MNFKNHTTPRYWPLTGDRGDVPVRAAGQTYKFNLKDIPPTTRKMCNYLVGILVTFNGLIKFTTAENSPTLIDWSDIARGMFESAEVQQSMFGTPVSANHFLGKYFGLFGFIANGMEQPVPEPPPFAPTTLTASTASHTWFIPLSALLGMKGHHTAQPACCYDRAQFILRTAGLGVVDGLSFPGNADTLQVTAVLLPEPELRLGPGTSFIQYVAAASATQTILTLDGLGNNSTLEGVEQGAGLAFLAWMGKGRGFGGAQDVNTIEYVNVPFRDLQQTRHIEPFLIDYLNACGGLGGQWVDAYNSLAGDYLSGGGHRQGLLYPVEYNLNGGSHSLLTAATMLPIITPHKFLETSKLQVVQGSQTVNMKSSGNFTDQQIFTALQYHSWTPAKQEEVLRKLIDSGTAQAVWGTNDLEPKLKVTGKQGAGDINPAKTRFFATTFVPKAKVSTPPTA